MIKRQVTKSIYDKLVSSNKIIAIYGARQTGKTTLANEVINNLSWKILRIDADQEKYISILGSRDLRQLKSLVTGFQLLFIDEAQRIPEIGINLKIIHDQIPELKVLVTGSSSLDLASVIMEPLTGRVWVYNLYPIAYTELAQEQPEFELNDQLDERLVFGSYPEIFSLINHKEKIEYLNLLSNSYLYKDIFSLSGIKYERKLLDLVRLLAFQIGSEVSLSELGSKLDLHKDTVASYIDLLEKSFVVFRLSGLRRNLRKEVSKMDKVYFYDLGIRNVVIDNLNLLRLRNDVGQLWENWLVVERLKKMNYQQILHSRYFWRTHTGAELDYVEEREGKLFGFEFKWNSKKTTAPNSWIENYPNSEYKLINSENYLDFVC